MAGDWIKFELETPDKPEVHHMAGMLNLDPDAVVGKLIRVWVWFDKHSSNGHATGVTYSLLDRLTSVTGFAEAMAFVGWLEQDGHDLIMPGFDTHNGESAKKRALSNRRKAKQRKGVTNVTKESQESHAESVTKIGTREEKRREDINTHTKGVAKPNLEELRDYCAERGITDTTLPERFLNHYDSNGWKVGKNSMKDWKAAVRTWEQTAKEKANAKNNRQSKPLSAVDRVKQANAKHLAADGPRVVHGEVVGKDG